MKISNLRLERGGQTARASATVSWEDGPRAPLEMFFETGPRGADHLTLEPEAFVTACILPAMRDGERRIRVEGALCPRLAAGATAAVDLLRSWYGPPRGPVTVEATHGLRPLAPRSPERAAFFFTGGIDSLHLLQKNRSSYPPDHPETFADCLSTFGHLCPTHEVSMAWNDLSVQNLAATAQAEHLGLITVRTNLWELERNVEFLAAESLSSAIASAAHLFRSRWSHITFAPGRDISRQTLRGAHPLLDPLFSSSALEVRHRTNRFTRFERLQAVASCPRHLENLVVCLAFPRPPYLNCGECEKCVRTMTALIALGKLSQARQFPVREVRPESIRAVPIGEHDADYWLDFLPLLAPQGRADLARAVEESLEESRRVRLWHADAGWRGRLRRLDRRLLGGSLVDLRRRLFS